ncbi:uncharacterized protein DUF4328 [Micromonospora sp. A202]|uniref:DUF4328 domain-containing protein n=1 Tax=Micromonospora sp. A202 TaxID=2572899 RepID=UPI00115148DA|nr:DUF4328 domain-containing protein [Micromonospora sp. A202]TQJ20427.1 uncharacterized protein DUF4328 [Micromonospora sp. A202]
MHCQTCGGATSPEHNECQRCYTPLGQPAVTPGLPTYRVRGLGLAARIAVGATTVLYLAVALSPLVGMALARQARVDNEHELLLAALIVQVVLSLPMVAAYLTAAVLVIIWTWRARKNIEAFPGALPTLGAGWAIAGWLVPFANLVMPVRVIANVARDSLWRRFTPTLVTVWWSAWLVFSIGERVVSRLDSRAYDKLPETPSTNGDYQAYGDYYRDSLLRNAVPAVACVIAAVALYLLIQRISAAQEARIARATPAWPNGPVWPNAPVWPAGSVPAGFAPGTVPPASVPAASVPPASEHQSRPVSPQRTPEAGGTIGA